MTGIYNVFSIRAEARSIDTSQGRSAVLTLTFCDADGNPLATQDAYFGGRFESNAYDIEYAIQNITEHHMEAVS